jgi:hypothetical protein
LDILTDVAVLGHVSTQRLASLVRWVLWAEALLWAGVSAALVMSPGRWTGTTGASLLLAAVLGAAAAAFAFVGMAVGREPPRLVWVALLLALGSAASSLTDQVGVLDWMAFVLNLALASACVLLLVRRQRLSRDTTVGRDSAGSNG